MHQLIRHSSLALVAALAAFAVAVSADTKREFADGVFRSSADPKMAVRIAAEFEYLGVDKFTLKEIANVERYHWVQKSDGDILAMIVIQLEGLLDGVEGSYRFGIPSQDKLAGSNFRYSPAPVKLGDHSYVQNTWAFDNRRSASDNPGAESARTLAFLEENDIELDDALIMSRYARALGDDRRKEVIIFYFESVVQNGYSLDEFPDGQPASERYDQLSQEVTARGRAAFEVLSTD